MAKKEELMDIDISKLTQETIKEYKRTAQRLVNEQYKRWERLDDKSPAARGLEKSGGKISFRGKDLNQQKKELARAVRFLEDKTRTFSGWEEEKQRQTNIINEQIEKSGGENTLTTDDFGRFYAAFDKAKEINPDIALASYKYNVMDALIEELKDETMSIDELAIAMSNTFQGMYEAAALHEEDATEEFF